MTTRTQPSDRINRGLIAALVAAVVVVAVLSYSLLQTAHRADRASQLALYNTKKINKIERGFCLRLDNVGDAVNRNGAIIYVVLGAVVENSKKAGHLSNAKDYERLRDLPRFQTAINCKQELQNPGVIKEQKPISFTQLGPDIIKSIIEGP